MRMRTRINMHMLIENDALVWVGAGNVNRRIRDLPFATAGSGDHHVLRSHHARAGDGVRLKLMFLRSISSD